MIRQWFPRSLVLALKKVEWELEVKLVEEILRSCEPEVRPDEPDGDSQWTRPHDLHQAVAEYRHWLGGNPLDEPWPFFLSQLQRLDGIRADHELMNARWYGLVHGGGKVDDLLRRAGYERAVPKAPEGGEAARESDAHTSVQDSNAAISAQLALMHIQRGGYA